MNDPRRERKRVWLAVLGSLFVHLLVAFSLAAFGASRGPALPSPEDAPVELTMMNLSATPPPTKPNPGFIENDPARESPEEPKERIFESNANSVAASNLPATGDAPVPTQQGADRPFLQMETQRHSLATEGSQPQPAQPTLPPQPTASPPPATPTPPRTTPTPPRATPVPTATPLPEPLVTPEPDRLAMLTGTPPPAIRDPQETEAEPTPIIAPTAPPVVPRPQPERPASAYRPEKEQNRISGRITNKGAPSVDAVATPIGRYRKAVIDAIGARWYYYTNAKLDLISIGTAQVQAEVDAEGKLVNLKLVSNTANEAFANICLQSFQEAQIPPIPADLVQTLPDGRLLVEISFNMTPPRTY
jgi:hypothetical protein